MFAIAGVYIQQLHREAQGMQQITITALSPGQDPVIVQQPCAFLIGRTNLATLIFDSEPAAMRTIFEIEQALDLVTRENQQVEQFLAALRDVRVVLYVLSHNHGNGTPYSA